MTGQDSLSHSNTRFEIRGNRIHCLVNGEGDALVLLHGLGSRSDDWEDQLPEFSKNYRVIAPDIRGYGQSRPSTGPYSVPEFAADVDELLNELGVDRAHLVGFSMGGAVAMQLAVDDPERWLSLTIVNSHPSFRADTFKRRLEFWMRKAIVRTLGIAYMARVVAARLFPEPGQADLRVRAQRRYADNDPGVYLATISELERFDLRDRLGEISCPVLVMASELDYFPLSDTRAWIGQVAQARLEVVAGARHGLPMERPDEFNQLLLGFLARSRA